MVMELIAQVNAKMEGFALMEYVHAEEVILVTTVNIKMKSLLS